MGEKRSRKREKAPGSSGTNEPKDSGSVRQRVKEVVANDAVSMVRSCVRSVKKNGGVAGLRYLLQVAGLYPAASGARKKETELLGDALGRELGLAKKHADEGEANSNVES
jgi:hypothetical protein